MVDHAEEIIRISLKRFERDAEKDLDNGIVLKFGPCWPLFNEEEQRIIVIRTVAHTRLLKSVRKN